MTDQEALDDAKRRYLQAQSDITRLRDKIAQEACPLNLGDLVTINDGKREYTGKVDHIGACLSVDELVGPIVGAMTRWCASGYRINKTSGETSKWTFSIPCEAELKDGVWHLPEVGIEAVLGLKKR